MNVFADDMARLLAKALEAERVEGRRQGLEQALAICDHLANMGNWDETGGAKECARLIRAKLSKPAG